MDKMNLYKCAQALSLKWKSFFGLGTEYVGYFKWEMAWALMGYYRYALPGEWADSASPAVILKSICDSIESINTGMDCAHRLPELWLNKDQVSVLPALVSVLDQYEKDIIDASSAEWAEWIDFLKSKCADKRKNQTIQQGGNDNGELQ